MWNKTAAALRQHVKTAQWWRHFYAAPKPAPRSSMLSGVGKKLLLTPLTGYLLANTGANAYTAYTGDRAPVHKLNELEASIMGRLMGGSAAVGNFVGDYLRNRDYEQAKSTARGVYNSVTDASNQLKEFLNNSQFIYGFTKDTLNPLVRKAKLQIQQAPAAVVKRIDNTAQTVKNTATAAMNPMWWFTQFPEQSMAVVRTAYGV